MYEKRIIAAEAERVGTDMIGFASASPFVEAERIFKERKLKGYLSGFEEQDIEKRVHPELLLSGCRSIISVGISYNVRRLVADPDKGGFGCTMSMSSWGEDYHRVLRERLDLLARFIRDRFGCATRYFADTGPLSDREAARRAGMGFIGKNSFLINDEYGSFVFLGEILTDLYLEPDETADGECGDCSLCIKACPTGALCGPYTLNAKRCVSYLTQCRDVEFDDYPRIGKSIYGCDICQSVCPFNGTARNSTHREFIPEKWNVNPDPLYILHIDNRGFNDTFGRTSSGWRGRKTLQRNALIALGNSGMDDAAGPIRDALKDIRPDIRKTAALGLYNLLGKSSFRILEDGLAPEEYDHIRRIIEERKS